MKILIYVALIVSVSGCAPPSSSSERLRRTAPERSELVPEPAGEAVAEADSRLVPRPWDHPSQTVTQDVDADLLRVLEREQLAGACEAYRAGDESEATRLRCGKWMFFYESFGTVGIPSHLLEVLQHWFEPYFGAGLEQMGFIPSPFDGEGSPIGLVESTQRMGSMKTHAFTCASCHFGQLPDGRYAVGYPNHQLDYGRFFASMISLIKLSINPNDSAVHPVVREALRGAVELARAQQGFMMSMAGLGLNVATRGGNAMSSGAIDLSPEEQLRFWNLRSGTMDFLTKPMVDDGVWTVSRIINLWNLPTPERIEAAGMPHALLSWTGIGESVMSFLHGFVGISGSSEHWDDHALQPLADYLYSLRAPPALEPAPRDAVERGAALFDQAGCLDCHGGPSGESVELYDFEDIGTDDTLRAIYNPSDDGELCCGLSSTGERATWSIKAPRLAGQRYRSRLLHNGSLDNLAQLLCLETRPADDNPGQSSQGHRYGCDELTDTQKGDLIQYLEHL